MISRTALVVAAIALFCLVFSNARSTYNGAEHRRIGTEAFKQLADEIADDENEADNAIHNRGTLWRLFNGEDGYQMRAGSWAQPYPKITFGLLVGLAGDFFSVVDPVAKGARENIRQQKFESLFSDFYNGRVFVGQDPNFFTSRVAALFDAEDDEVDGLAANRKYQAYGNLNGDNFRHEQNLALVTRGEEPLSPDSDGSPFNNLVFRSSVYMEFASSNLDHFARWAHRAYVAAHRAALEQAEEARNRNDRSLLVRAFLKEAFALHYLTDQFAAGHIRTPREELVNECASDQAAGLLAKYNHDEDNWAGLFMRNHNNDEWWGFGDGMFAHPANDDNRRMAVEAARTSMREVWDVYKAIKTPRAYELTLEPENDGLFAGEYLVDKDADYFVALRMIPSPLLTSTHPVNMEHRPPLYQLRGTDTSRWLADGTCETDSRWSYCYIYFRTTPWMSPDEPEYEMFSANPFRGTTCHSAAFPKGPIGGKVRKLVQAHIGGANTPPTANRLDALQDAWETKRERFEDHVERLVNHANNYVEADIEEYCEDNYILPHTCYLLKEHAEEFFESNRVVPFNGLQHQANATSGAKAHNKHQLRHQHKKHQHKLHHRHKLPIMPRIPSIMDFNAVHDPCVPPPRPEPVTEFSDYVTNLYDAVGNGANRYLSLSSEEAAEREENDAAGFESFKVKLSVTEFVVPVNSGEGLSPSDKIKIQVLFGASDIIPRVSAPIRLRGDCGNDFALCASVGVAANVFIPIDALTTQSLPLSFTVLTEDNKVFGQTIMTQLSPVSIDSLQDPSIEGVVPVRNLIDAAAADGSSTVPQVSGYIRYSITYSLGDTEQSLGDEANKDKRSLFNILKKLFHSKQKESQGITEHGQKDTGVQPLLVTQECFDLVDKESECIPESCKYFYTKNSANIQNDQEENEDEGESEKNNNPGLFHVSIYDQDEDPEKEGENLACGLMIYSSCKYTPGCEWNFYKGRCTAVASAEPEREGEGHRPQRAKNDLPCRTMMHGQCARADTCEWNLKKGRCQDLEGQTSI